MDWSFIKKCPKKKRCIDITVKKKYKTNVNMEPTAVHDQRGLHLKDKTCIKNFPGRAANVLKQHSSQISQM